MEFILNGATPLGCDRGFGQRGSGVGRRAEPFPFHSSDRHHARRHLSLILGELVPKRLALNNPERIAAKVARPMRSLSAIASPVVRLLSFSTESMLRLLGVRRSEEPPVTEEEIKRMIAQGTEAGVFSEAEQDIVMNTFRLGDRRIGALMTPHHELVWLDLNESPDEIERLLEKHRHSRFRFVTGTLTTCSASCAPKISWPHVWRAGRLMFGPNCGSRCMRLKICPRSKLWRC